LATRPILAATVSLAFLVKAKYLINTHNFRGLFTKYIYFAIFFDIKLAKIILNTRIKQGLFIKHEDDDLNVKVQD